MSKETRQPPNDKDLFPKNEDDNELDEKDELFENLIARLDNGEAKAARDLTDWLRGQVGSGEIDDETKKEIKDNLLMGMRLCFVEGDLEEAKELLNLKIEGRSILLKLGIEREEVKQVFWQSLEEFLSGEFGDDDKARRMHEWLIGREDFMIEWEQIGEVFKRSAQKCLKRADMESLRRLLRWKIKGEIVAEKIGGREMVNKILDVMNSKDRIK